MGAVSYKCPNCGGDLQFDPAGQQYKCEYCGSVFTQQELDAMQPPEGSEQQGFAEESAQTEDDGFSEPSGMGQAVIYSCPSCGAEIVTDETTAATFCYYCHNPVVLSGRLSGEYLPDHIIPFQIDRNQAIESIRKHIQKKMFVPKAFFDEQQIEKVSGIYYPYWVYDCDGDASIQGEATRSRVFRSGDYEVTETDVFTVEREGSIHLENLTRNALKKSDRALVENVQPYSLQQMKPFSMGYLSGFFAEKRDMEKDQFYQDIKKTVEGYSENLLRDTVSGYGTFTVMHKDFQPRSQHWQYVLLPVWVLTYIKGEKIYYFALNGQNGNVSGKLPVDGKKLAFAAILIFLVVTALGLIGGFFI